MWTWFSAFCSVPRSSQWTGLHLNILHGRLFLVSLATAKRVSELQALSGQVVCQGNNMVLSYLPEFIAKTETLSHSLPREFTLTSLTAAVGADDEKRLLCPIQALRWYLRRTRSESRPRQLFLSVKDRERTPCLQSDHLLKPTY